MRSTDYRCFCLAFATLSACGQAVSPTDGGTPRDTAADSIAVTDEAVRDASVDAGSFCTTGASTWMEINGVVSTTAAVHAQIVGLDCCDAASIAFVSARFRQGLSVMWRAPAGAMPTLPATVDLEHLPTGWGVQVFEGCDPTTSGCTPTDRFDTDLHGTLSVARTGTGYAMNVCVSFDENPASPHPTTHSFRLASGDVTTL
jgi:hypothetical protein